MKKFLVLMAAVLSFNVFAGSCSQQVNNITGLNAATRQAMVIQCEQAKLENLTSPDLTEEATVEKLDQWSEISLKFAKAIGVAAKEVGVATNEFLGTPAGKFTAALILWKVLSVNSWLMFLMINVSTAMLVASFLRFMRIDRYEEVDTRFGKRKQPLYSSWKDMGETQAFLSVCAYIVLVVVLLISGINLF